MTTMRPRNFLRFECKECDAGIVSLVASWRDVDTSPQLTAQCPNAACEAEMVCTDPGASHAIPPPEGAPFVFIATTQRKNEVTSTYALGMLRVPSVLSYAGIRSIIRHQIGGSIQTQRSKLVTDMLATKATHMMFIDDDLDFLAEDIVRLVQHDRDVVAGVYAKREIEWPQVIAASKAGKDPRMYSSVLAMDPLHNAGHLVIDGELLEAVSVSAGFLLIKREVLERMIANYPELIFCDGAGKEHSMLFDTSINDGIYATEDVTFSRRWRQMGGRIWVDMKARIGHCGEFEYVAPTLAERFAPPAP